jgi:ribosome-associated protein
MGEDVLEIVPGLSIPVAELSFRASRSGGPGGQHVNTSSTRVELIWDVAGSPSLSEEQRARIQNQLMNRISNEGVLILAGSGSRSQHRNREEVTERLADMLRSALHVPKKRRKTKPTRASREARLDTKKKRSQTKRLRKSVPLD